MPNGLVTHGPENNAEYGSRHPMDDACSLQRIALLSRVDVLPRRGLILRFFRLASVTVQGSRYPLALHWVPCTCIFDLSDQ